jgi:adenylate kinase family enzyme
MTPLAATASAPTVAERDLHVARVQAAVRAWQPYLEGRASDPPAVQYRASEGPENAVRLDLLCRLFGLDALEADVVLTLWVLAFVPEWRPAIAALDGGREDVTALCVSRAHGHPPQPRLRSDAPLLSWHIVSEGRTESSGNPGLSLDPHILAWLEGRHEPDRALMPLLAQVQGGEALPSWPVASTVAAVRETFKRGDRLRVQLITRDRNAATSFAAVVAAAVGLPVLAIGSGAHEPANRDTVVRLQRQAFLDRCALLWPRAFTTDEVAQPPAHIAWFPLQFTVTDAPAPGSFPGARDLVVVLPAPAADERRTLWQRALPESRAWDRAAFNALAQRYVALPADIAEVAAMRPSSPAEAVQHLLARSRGDLGTLAQRLDTPFVWDDLVVPPALRGALRDIAFEAGDRVGFWEQPHVARLFPQGRGLVTLFCGPPGTGKTMAAQVIAGELGLDLYRVDLSAVISKWVGETSQNLQKILARAADRNVALFFDEADALYGKRVDEVRDAQDRFANMDVSHLMVAIENYSGVVLLASNLKTNIDPAFIRRIRYCVEFPKPDRTARREIWGRVVAGVWGPNTASTLSAALDALSDHDATGAQIKNACLTAAFAARQQRGKVSRPMLARGLARELAKDGQGLSERALANLVDDTKSRRGGGR